MDPQHIHSNVSLGTRIQHWYNSIYICTRIVFSTCVGLYLIQAVLGLELRNVCLLTGYVINQWQIWRLLSSVVFHGGIMHLAFNMIAFLPTGKQLEANMGTVKLFYLILLLTMMEGLLYILVMLMLDMSGLWSDAASVECAVGFSGVIFGLIAVSTQESQMPSYNVFGLFQVPSKYYPWVLLAVIQFLSPKVSLVGHLAGLLAGYMYAWGYLKFLMLSNQIVGRIENMWPFRLINKMDAFIKVGSPLPTMQQSQPFQPSTSQSQQATLTAMLQKMAQMQTAKQDEEPEKTSKESNFSGQGRLLGGGQSSLAQDIENQSRPWAAAAEARAKNVTQ